MPRQLQEAVHLGGGKSYEVECALFVANFHIVQLKYSCQVIVERRAEGRVEIVLWGKF